ncbi:MAG: hypothetical protein JXA04_07910 [Gammaproteobacteria bacterium]|nr:hypothetical protein [Gammaproteobacteria bacterium]
MAFTWQFESDECVVIRISGQAGYKEIVNFLDEIRKETSRCPEIYELIICSQDLHVELSSDLAQLVADRLLENLRAHESGALAFVCGSDHVFGLCRQLGMRVENDQMLVDVFRTESEARDWLLKLRSLNTV